MPIQLQIHVPTWRIVHDRKATAKVMRAAASEVAGVARRMIRAGSRQHPSEPGQPPASKTGQLASAIRVRVKTTPGAIVARVIDSAIDKAGRPYGKFLETGRAGRSAGVKRRHRRMTVAERQATSGQSGYMAPRPYLTLALEQRETSITRRINDAIMNDMKFQRIK